MKIKRGSVITFTYQADKKSPKYNGIAAYDSETKTKIKVICYMLYGEGLPGVVCPEPYEFSIKQITNLDIEHPADRIKFQDTFYNMGYIYDSHNAKLYRN